MKNDIMADIQIMKRKDKKELESLITTSLELILIKWISMIMKNLVE